VSHEDWDGIERRRDPEAHRILEEIRDQFRDQKESNKTGKFYGIVEKLVLGFIGAALAVYVQQFRLSDKLDTWVERTESLESRLKSYEVAIMRITTLEGNYSVLFSKLDDMKKSADDQREHLSIKLEELKESLYNHNLHAAEMMSKKAVTQRK
jgi:hypothetical protein